MADALCKAPYLYRKSEIGFQNSSYGGYSLNVAETDWQ